jgi:hypothetical protein
MSRAIRGRSSPGSHGFRTSICYESELSEVRRRRVIAADMVGTVVAHCGEGRNQYTATVRS